MINWIINKLLPHKPPAPQQPDAFAEAARFISENTEPSKHHQFVLYSRNQWTGRTSYRCRCGAWYANGWAHGWKLSEYNGPYVGKSCKRVQP